ncbi:hypothetical protein KI688_000680 [Linnemannia hyalina]|uniref:F-box domain-containing protein n=1 Tax=Linnemannia hyalina TaxID=64524 RepID=A0A9P7Y6X7_9FUNG|nr:hypothetical protein KI688_000680 [Linnemannia hyalina]
MFELPPELVLAIGTLLDNRSLVACLRVSQDWHCAFLPLVWGTISKKSWTHYSFPLTTWTPLSSNLPRTHPRAHSQARVHRYLQHVQSLTWHNNNALLRDKVITCPPSQMHLRQLSIVLQRTPNLTSLSLAMATHGIEGYIISSILHLLQQLEHLVTLEVDIPRQGSVTPIEQHFPLFAKLEELKIPGDWYSGETIRTLETAAAVTTENTTLWKLRRLEIDRIDISFFRQCPQLEHVTLSNPTWRCMVLEDSAVKEVIVGQLQRLLGLKSMVVYMSFGRRKHMPKIMKVEGNEMMWTHEALFPGDSAVGQDVFSLRDVFGLYEG